MSHSRSKLAKAITGLVFASTIAPSHAQLILEEILVTAQKRSESIQDVPISIQAFSGEQIIQAGAVDYETLSDSIPNVDISSAPGIKSVAVRGMRSGSGNVGFEQSVGLFVDGIYGGRIELFQEPFLDIARLEVLKGPQGVLFGKNSIAGALATHTARPTDEFEGSISAEYESEYDSYQVTGVLSGPITDSLSARLAIRNADKGAFMDNVSTGYDAGADEATTIRASFDWDVSDNTSIWFKAETGEVRREGLPWFVVADNTPGSLASLFAATGRGILSNTADPTTGAPALLDTLVGLRAVFGGIPADQPLPPVPGLEPLLAGVGATTFLEEIYFGAVEGGETYQDDGLSDINNLTFADQETDNFALEISHNIGDYELVYLGGFGQFDRTSSNDSDFNAVEALLTTDARYYEQTSHEFRLVSPKGETLEYIVGAYYLDREIEINSVLDLFGFGANATDFYQDLSLSQANDFVEEIESLAVFASVTWNISDTFKATVGARYSDEEKKGLKARENYDYLTRDVLTDTNPAKAAFVTSVLGSVEGFSFTETIDETAFDPSVNIQWAFNDRSMAYLSWTKATKAGGFDNGATTVDSFTFDTEEATSIELGLKTEFLDGRARVNAAVFFTEFDDLQVSVFDPTAGDTGNGAFVTGNAAKASTDGIELDAMFAVSESLTVGANVAYLKAEYDEFFTGCPNNPVQTALLDCQEFNPGAGPQLDLSGVQMENAPEYTATMFADYVINLSNFDVGMRIDANFKDETKLDFSQDTNLTEEDYWKFNVQVSLDSASDSWSLGLGVFNLTDEQPSTFGGQSFGVNGLYWKNYTRGREVKASATYRF